MNPLQLIRNIGRGANPQQLAMQMMKNNSNSIMSNLMDMAERGNTQGIEQFARNMCKEKGIDFDKEFPKFMNGIR